MVDLHGPGFTTSPSTTVSQVFSPIPTVLPTCRDSPELDTYTQYGVSPRLSFAQNMSMLTKHVPPLETTTPRTRSDQQVQLNPYPNDMGLPYTPLSINQPGSYSRFSPHGFPNYPAPYYPPTPHIQTTPSYRPNPYRQGLTGDNGSPFVAQSPLGEQTPPRHSSGGYTSYDYHGASEKTNNLQNTVNIASQRSNVHHSVFSGSVLEADGFQNTLTSNRVQMHLSNTSDRFQSYNSNDRTENPAPNPTNTFTTSNDNKRYPWRY